MNISRIQLVVQKDVLYRKVETDAVIVNLSDNHYYRLDEIGSRMWEVLTESESVQDGLAVLLSEFDVDSETLERSIRELIDQWASNGLVILRETRKGD